ERVIAPFGEPEPTEGGDSIHGRCGQSATERPARWSVGHGGAHAAAEAGHNGSRIVAGSHRQSETAAGADLARGSGRNHEMNIRRDDGDVTRVPLGKPDSSVRTGCDGTGTGIS